MIFTIQFFDRLLINSVIINTVSPLYGYSLACCNALFCNLIYHSGFNVGNAYPNEVLGLQALHAISFVLAGL